MRTLVGEKATREVWVCDAGACVVLKAPAFDSRGEDKDAYDLFYVIRNYGGDIGDKRRSLLDDDETIEAVDVLRRDFTDPEAVATRCTRPVSPTCTLSFYHRNAA